MATEWRGAPVSPVAAGLRGRCPRCGQGRLFASFLGFAPECEVCGLDYGFIDTGDGPAFFVSSLAGIVVAGLALITEVLYEPPLWVYAAVFGPLILLLCIGPLRPLKGLMGALQYRNRAEQGRLES